MKFFELQLPGAYVVELEPFQDSRGRFARTFCKREFLQIGHSKEFVQFNFSVTTRRGAIRGMHYQIGDSREVKLIRCIRGSIFDVIIDLRANSPTFLRYQGVELSEKNMKSIYVPEGFAHGFQTLSDDCQLIYHHTNYYAPANEYGVNAFDPKIKINWPVDVTEMSDKDRHYKNLQTNFKGIEI